MGKNQDQRPYRASRLLVIRVQRIELWLSAARSPPHDLQAPSRRMDRLRLCSVRGAQPALEVLCVGDARQLCDRVPENPRWELVVPWICQPLTQGVAAGVRLNVEKRLGTLRCAPREGHGGEELGLAAKSGARAQMVDGSAEQQRPGPRARVLLGHPELSVEPSQLRDHAVDELQFLAELRIIKHVLLHAPLHVRRGRKPPPYRYCPKPFTYTGVSLLFVVPSPSCPWAPLPQHETLPSE